MFDANKRRLQAYHPFVQDSGLSTALYVLDLYQQEAETGTSIPAGGKSESAPHPDHPKEVLDSAYMLQLLHDLVDQKIPSYDESANDRNGKGFRQLAKRWHDEQINVVTSLPLAILLQMLMEADHSYHSNDAPSSPKTTLTRFCITMRTEIFSSLRHGQCYHPDEVRSAVGETSSLSNLVERIRGLKFKDNRIVERMIKPGASTKPKRLQELSRDHLDIIDSELEGKNEPLVSERASTHFIR